jgi:hypothetical protein
MDIQTALSSSLHPISRLSFYDELEKIASERQPKNNKVKRWLKSTAIVSAGAGIGTGAYMGGERLAKKLVGKRWDRMNPKTRLAILGPASALAGYGAARLTRKVMRKKQEHDK